MVLLEAINGEVPGFYYGSTTIPSGGGSDLHLDLKPGPSYRLAFHPSFNHMSSLDVQMFEA